MSAGFKIDPERVKREFERQIGRGLRGAAAFAANRAKEIVSVPAPRRRLRSGEGQLRSALSSQLSGLKGLGKENRKMLAAQFREQFKKQRAGLTSYVIAATAATPGAPPRKLTGTLRSRITSEVISDTQARVGLRLDYGAVHEYGDHPFLSVMVEQNRDALARLIAGG